MLPLPLSTALLGGLVTVPTLRGLAQLHIPPCVPNGHVLRISGAGIHITASLQDSHKQTEEIRGDMVYHVLILIPSADKLSGRQREALGVYDRYSNVSNMEDKKDEKEMDVFEQCAKLKQQYCHWFTNS
uniref:Chaperone protein DnaJ n=1 Tax=Lygus hesperus TaxID=30085 RepID=A0A0A9XE32_LYGHE